MKVKEVTKDQVIKALQESWRAEVESAAAYRDLSQNEKDERRRQILIRMADAEDRHAVKFGERLRALGSEPPLLHNGLKQKWRHFTGRLLGTDIALRQMEAVEDRQAASYGRQQEDALAFDEEAAALLHEIKKEEQAHSRTIKKLAPILGPQTTLDYLFKRERWHGRGGSWVSDAIYGANDGLGAVFGIVSGVAGATQNQQHYILISGLAAMLASALSMGSGAYLAVKSQREVHEAEIGHERRELEEDPEEEIEEMALFYQLQGFDVEQSMAMARRLAEDPEQMLRTMAQSELGLSDERMGNPLVSAFSAALSTAIGAFIPIIPFFFLSGWSAIVVAAVISLIAHFLIGAAKTLITGRSWLYSGAEMTLVGAVEGVITYGLGLAFGKM
ncbi:MAG: VIT1/CCC1 transporter family protein [Armatimonadota bacterium]|nr:VIT1/CCC1 transporter family protein [Armatimonadota bacterium]